MKKLILILLPVLFILISCSKERTPDPFFSATITGTGLDEPFFFEATTALGELGDSIKVIAGDPSGIFFQFIVPSNNKRGSYTIVNTPAATPAQAQMQYTPNLSDLSKLTFADSGTFNVTKLDDEGWENLIDGNFNLRVIGITDTFRIVGEFASIPLVLK
jgi:hypothetical protein